MLPPTSAIDDLGGLRNDREVESTVEQEDLGGRRDIEDTLQQ